MNIVKEIRKVLKEQSKSINQMNRFVGGNFVQAVDLLYKCKGKVIVTGIGKSGLVSQKIAATLSSTGTPAIYLHPSEGLHGYLGVVHKSDVVLAIGKSGESEELLGILPSIRKIGAKIISITGNKKSTLAKKSQIVLHVPIEREVCPLNLAPTTSSTLNMVIGDAIAVTLMKKREFSPEKFALYHPGGQLGQRILFKVKDIMRGGKNNPVVRKTATMDQLLIEISKKWAGAASVVNKKGKLVGLVTDFDIRKSFAKGDKISNLSIIDIMNSTPTYVYSDETALKALSIMESRRKPLTVLPVVDRKKRSVGMIHAHDLLTRGLIGHSDQQGC